VDLGVSTDIVESYYIEGEVDISLRLSGTFSLKGWDRGDVVVVVPYR
jgi:hypothetical protein